LMVLRSVILMKDPSPPSKNYTKKQRIGGSVSVANKEEDKTREGAAPNVAGNTSGKKNHYRIKPTKGKRRRKNLNLRGGRRQSKKRARLNL